MSVLTADPNAVSAGEEPPDTGERRRLTSVTGHRSQPAWDRGLRQGVHRADGRFRRLDLRPHRRRSAPLRTREHGDRGRTRLGPRGQRHHRGRAAPAESLRLRLCRSDRGRGHRQPRPLLPGHARKARPARRGRPRNRPRCDAHRPVSADRPFPPPARRRRHGSRPARGLLARPQLGFLRAPVRDRDPAGPVGEHLLRRPAGAAEAAGPRQLHAARIRPEGGPPGPPARCPGPGPRLGRAARLLRRRHQHPRAALHDRRLRRLHPRAGGHGPALATGRGGAGAARRCSTASVGCSPVSPPSSSPWRSSRRAPG